MFWVAREEPNETSRIDGCMRLPSRAACVSAFSPPLLSVTVFTSRFFQEELVDALQ